MIKALRSQDDGWHRRPPAGPRQDRPTLRCDVNARDAASADLTFIGTTWRWRFVEGETHPEVMQECSAGCVAVGESHDLRHRHAGTDNDDNPIYPGPFTNRVSADSTD